MATCYSTTCFLLLVFILQCCLAQQRTAVAVIQSTSNADSSISGTVTFTETGNDQIQIRVQVSGLTVSDQLGIHIHNWGDITDESGSAFGPHWIGAGGDSHGCPPSANRHEGDLGSWDISNGVIDQTKTVNLVTLSGGTSIIGRGVILHDIPDPCDDNPTGARIAMGVIGIANLENNPAGQSTNPDTLICRLQATSNCNDCSGTVWFEDLGSSIRVTARIEGLTPGTRHGLHIHAYGDITDSELGTSLGGHYNPENNNHGLPPVSSRHEGDMGNVQNYDGNVAWYEYDNQKISSTGAIAGRGVVLHETFDHGAGQGCDAAGSSGVRYATCVIGIASDDISIPSPNIPIDNSFSDVDCEVSLSSESTLSSSSFSSFSSSSRSSFSNSPFSSFSANSDDDSSSSDASLISISALICLIVFCF